MDDSTTIIEKSIQLSADRVERLHHLAQTRQVSEDQLIAQALDVYFSLSEGSTTPKDKEDWSLVSEEALGRIWDNEADDAYDDWKGLYGSPAR